MGRIEIVAPAASETADLSAEGGKPQKRVGD
jgi:hypothetical protein